MLWTKGRLGIAPGLKMTKVTFTFFQGDTATKLFSHKEHCRDNWQNLYTD